MVEDSSTRPMAESVRSSMATSSASLGRRRWMKMDGAEASMRATRVAPGGRLFPVDNGPRESRVPLGAVLEDISTVSRELLDHTSVNACRSRRPGSRTAPFVSLVHKELDPNRASGPSRVATPDRAQRCSVTTPWRRNSPRACHPLRTGVEPVEPAVARAAHGAR